ncbi:MAG: hypothetical protein R3Y64_02295, partial [Peptostreptococcaceae bacterium]
NKNSDLENKNSDLENKNSDLENKNSDLENKNSDLENKNSESKELLKGYGSREISYKENINELNIELTQYKSSKLYKVQHRYWKLKGNIRYYIKKYKYIYAYKIYRKVEKYPKATRMLHRINNKFNIIESNRDALQTYIKSVNNSNNKSSIARNKKRVKELKIACILDEFSYNCFEEECILLNLEPSNWKDIFDKEKPDLFLCESAWSGLDSKLRPWKGQVYSSINFSKENRLALLSILDYCKDNDIPTVFWNKEDPSHYHDKVHNFVDTAIKFDHIFTTAKECVDMYKNEYNHKSVNYLMFATQPNKFNPIEKYDRTEDVIFAGSWYSYHEDRCIEMENIFDNIIKSGKNLKIYNRYHNDPDPNHIFPKKYEKYLLPSLSYEELEKAYKGSKYALNINTVTESDTMFARRIFELMSSNTLVISNYSKGIYRLFGDNVVYTNNELEFNNIESKCYENLNDVLNNHTYKHRLQEILNKIDFKYINEIDDITIYYIINNESDIEESINNFNSIKYKDKKCVLILTENIKNEYIQQLISMYKSNLVDMYSIDFCKKYGNNIKCSSKYFCIGNKNLNTILIENGYLHYSYIDTSTPIKINQKKYVFNKEYLSINTLYVNSIDNDIFEILIDMSSIRKEVYYI